MKSGASIWWIPGEKGNWYLFDCDLEKNCHLAAELGYDGIELIVPSAREADRDRLQRALSANGLKLATVSSGGGGLMQGLSFCSADAGFRGKARKYGTYIVDFAGSFGAEAIFGVLKGRVEQGVERDDAFGWLRDAMEEMAQAAANCGLNVLVEPQNRYEINLINRLGEAAAFIDTLDAANVRIVADLFHMNIEERSICQALRDAAAHIGHVHLADSNRLPPGHGHIDFAAVGRTLREIGYDGYVVAECMAFPDSRQAAETVLACFRDSFRPDA